MRKQKKIKKSKFILMLFLAAAVTLSMMPGLMPGVSAEDGGTTAESQTAQSEETTVQEQTGTVSTDEQIDNGDVNKDAGEKTDEKSDEAKDTSNSNDQLKKAAENAGEKKSGKAASAKEDADPAKGLKVVAVSMTTGVEKDADNTYHMKSNSNAGLSTKVGINIIKGASAKYNDVWVCYKYKLPKFVVASGGTNDSPELTYTANTYGWLSEMTTGQGAASITWDDNYVYLTGRTKVGTLPGEYTRDININNGWQVNGTTYTPDVSVWVYDENAADLGESTAVSASSHSTKPPTFKAESTAAYQPYLQGKAFDENSQDPVQNQAAQAISGFYSAAKGKVYKTAEEATTDGATDATYGRVYDVDVSLIRQGTDVGNALLDTSKDVTYTVDFSTTVLKGNMSAVTPQIIGVRENTAYTDGTDVVYPSVGRDMTFAGQLEGSLRDSTSYAGGYTADVSGTKLTITGKNNGLKTGESGAYRSKQTGTYPCAYAQIFVPLSTDPNSQDYYDATGNNPNQLQLNCQVTEAKYTPLGGTEETYTSKEGEHDFKVAIAQRDPKLGGGIYDSGTTSWTNASGTGAADGHTATLGQKNLVFNSNVTNGTREDDYKAIAMNYMQLFDTSKLEVTGQVSVTNTGYADRSVLYVAMNRGTSGYGWSDDKDIRTHEMSVAKMSDSKFTCYTDMSDIPSNEICVGVIVEFRGGKTGTDDGDKIVSTALKVKDDVSFIGETAIAVPSYQVWWSKGKNFAGKDDYMNYEPGSYLGGGPAEANKADVEMGAAYENPAKTYIPDLYNKTTGDYTTAAGEQANAGRSVGNTVVIMGYKFSYTSFVNMNGDDLVDTYKAGEQVNSSSFPITAGYRQIDKVFKFKTDWGASEENDPNSTFNFTYTHAAASDEGAKIIPTGDIYLYKKDEASGKWVKYSPGAGADTEPAVSGTFDDNGNRTDITGTGWVKDGNSWKIDFSIVGEGEWAIAYSCLAGDGLDPDTDPINNAYDCTGSISLRASKDNNMMVPQGGVSERDNIVNPQGLYSYKKEVKNIVAPGESIAYTITAGAEKTDLKDYFLLDILPFNGDGRGTKMDGSYTFTDNELTVNAYSGKKTSVDMYYSTDEGVRTDASGKLKDASQFITGTGASKQMAWTPADGGSFGGGTWHKAEKTVSADGHTITYSVKASDKDKRPTAFFLYGTLGGSERVTANVNLTAKDNEAGNLYYNDSSFSSPSMLLDTFVAKEALVTIATREMKGTVWVDLNGDGKRNSDEPLVKGAKVVLHSGDPSAVGKTASAKNAVPWDTSVVNENALGEPYGTVTTDSEGKYRFDMVPFDNDAYYVTLESSSGFDISQYSLTEYKASGIDETLNSDFSPILSEQKLTKGVSDRTEYKSFKDLDVTAGDGDISKEQDAGLLDVNHLWDDYDEGDNDTGEKGGDGNGNGDKKGKAGKVTKTGDDSSMSIAALMMLLAAGTATGSYFFRRKKIEK
ncbi:MAG: SdrD B-like domain-containing protein [Eubacteriaceae bacterium]|nr:SdrD B-like domain-containing protein [Eubacteriaceae bacterium]